MPVTVLIGAQWGDEGKGRVVDWLARDAQVVARYNGGDNAGHSITIGSRVIRLHLVPSGIFYKDVACLLAAGMVINPKNLLREMDEIQTAGYDVSPARLTISHNAHLVLPTHVALDAALEKFRGGDAIGTTQRGIGVAYSAKMLRTNLRAADLREPEHFADALHKQVTHANQQLAHEYRAPALNADALSAEYYAYAKRLASYIGDTSPIVHAVLARGGHIVAEGAQGVLLDIDMGTYPYVTSSNTGVAGALSGLGIGPQPITRIVGVLKAFNTRVGAGPFPTELFDATGAHLRGTGANPWDEYGSTTGRPRRTGWLDLVALKYATRNNGVTELVITKMDVLSGFGALKLCTGYRYKGELLADFPADAAVLQQVEPVYESAPGWAADVSGARKRSDLPAAARAYIARIEEFTGVPASLISVGPERDQIIIG
ncbi:MAG: adenylosuccinate synthase [Chloroflexi bacterium]|nr:adenylosuccinate synthase [Chloroflexota bacterium]